MPQRKASLRRLDGRVRVYLAVEDKVTFDLNPEQQAAVNAHEGAFKVEACAGTGKTRVITERYRRLRGDGFTENEILSLTFTKSAADEMRQRAGAQKGGRGGFRTFHSFCLNLISEERAHLPFKLAEDPVPSNGQIPRALKKIIRGFRGLRYRDAREFISLAKRRGVSPSQAIAESANDYLAAELAQVYAEYERQMRQEGWLDFESMQFEAWKLLRDKAEVRDRWQFRLVQVDEAQDCEEIQWRVVQMLTQRHGNLFCVGDVNQSLYEWRGASPETFLNLDKYFPALTVLYLGLNYRSTKAIVDFCREIAPIKTGLVEHMRSGSEQGEAPVVMGFGSDSEEAYNLIRGIDAPSRSAILVRTNRQLRAFEDVCLRDGIRYNLLGRSGFWERGEIQDLLAFARFIEAPYDDGAVARIIRSPYPCSKYLGSKFIETASKPLYTYLADPRNARESYQRTAARNLRQVLDEIVRYTRGRYPADQLETVIELAGMKQYFGADDDSEDADNSAMENLQEAVLAARRFDTLANLVAHSNRAIHASRSQQGLTLSTIHQAKGREWESVYVAGVNEEVLPHKNGEPAEEARIWYVACSRPAKRLVISYYERPSVFVPGQAESQLSFSEERGAA